MKLPWKQTEIELNLANEPGQELIDSQCAEMLRSTRPARDVTQVYAIDRRILERWQSEAEEARDE